MKLYVVQEIKLKSDGVSNGAIIGVYTTRWLAKLAISELSGKSSGTIYDIISIRPDTLPIDIEEYEEAIENLIKTGMIEALVGEDGCFYYEPTELGKAEGKKLMDRYRKKRDKEDNGGD